MRKKLTSLLLAIVMLLQVFIPPNIGLAEGEETPPQGKYVKVGEINAKSYDAKIMNELNRIAAKTRTSRSQRPGVSLFSSGPYFGDNNEPKDVDKPKYFGNVSAELDLNGLDGNPFQWNEIFGVDENGNPKPAQIIFRQMDYETSVDTGVYYMLQITKEGKYTWSDGEGKPSKLPLFSKSFKPYRYEVRIDERVTDKVKLLTSVSFGTQGSSPTFLPENADGEIIGNIKLGLTYNQIASTKFKSEWHTGVSEEDRPDMKANFAFDDEGDGVSPVSVELPKNDKDTKIIRDWYNDFDPDLVLSVYLEKTPDVKIDTSTAGLTFDTTNKTVKSDDHKFKYDFTYDVINGGKLTMTEILPITFDANEGKFSSITDPKADQQIVKEVEYGKDLTEEVEEPKKDLETFKGWAETADGPALSEADFKAKTTNVTEAKTFYAIWGNNDITAEELVVHESFKDGDNWINEFTPNMEKLEKQIRIKGEDGKYTPLNIDDHGFAVLDDTGKEIKSFELANSLYDKLKEDDKTEVSRNTTIKVRVDFKKTGKNVVIEVPIKVIKNIYEAKTKEGRPNYVPEDYVKVTVDPTTTAEKPQKYFYYVNPNAKVVIPGEDPVGVGDNLFVRWIMKADDATGDGSLYELTKRPRTMFEKNSTIKAEYTKDVIPQEGTEEPKNLPDNFVKVIFNPTEKGDMEGAKIFWVKKDRDVIIPVKNPVGNQYYTFKEWKIGANADGEVYEPGVKKKFENETIITATYKESPNIIPFDPTNTDDSKIFRPDGYVKVTFEAEKGLKLTEQKAYYVKANAGIKLGNDELKKPAYTEEDGYKFEKWDKEDATEIKADDIVVKAISKPLGDVIPANKEDGSPNEKPKGYITVTFKTTDKGGNIEKVLYLNPNKAVALEAYAPSVVPKTGYDFAGWDRPINEKIQYKDKTVITAQFNEKGAVIPKTNPDGSENKQPEGYKTVTFIIEPAEGGKIADGEVTVYYVNPDKEVTIQQPKTEADTGYEFEKWDQDTVKKAKKYTDDTTVKGNFKKLDDIIPANKEDGTPNEKPEGYVTLTFDKGEHGKDITGQTVYYVNPKADPSKTLGDTSIVKPEVKAEVGYKFTGWDTDDDTQITENKTVKAQYEEIDDVIPEKDDQGNANKKPDGYITVTFDKGEHGKELTGQAAYYVNPNKAVVLKDKAPEVTPDTGYDFAAWDTSIERAIQYKDKDKITALYNKKGDVIPQENPDGSDKPAGYLIVTFDKGEHGKEITGKTVYYVKPNTEVTVPAPTVTPNTGWKQKDGDDAWDSKLTRKFTEENTDITAQYDQLEAIIPQKNTDDSDKPEGYKVVKFVADENGSLSGKTVYYVNPEKEVDLTTTANGIVKKPNVGYVADGGKWINEDNTDAVLNATFNQDKTFVYHFQPYKDVIPAENIDQKPEGYVKVEFIAGDNGSLVGGNKTYYVNPLKDITVGSNDLPIPETQANDNYKFDAWYEKIDQTEPIKTDKKFVARFKLAKVTMTYEADDKTSGEVPAALSYDVGTEITLAGGNDLKKDNYSLTGWMIGEKIYKPGEKITLNENTTAVAVWDENLHTVQFDTDGGNYIPAQKVKHNTAIGEVPSPTKKGYLFVGWTLDGKIINPEEYKVTKDITLVAEYSEDVIPADNDGNPPAGTPENFVKVIFVPTAEGKLEGTSIFYVNPAKEVIIPVNNPVGKGKKIFSTWKLGADAKGVEYNPKEAKLFDKDTIITATYEEKSISSGEIIEVNGVESNPMKVDKDDKISDDQLISQLILPKGKSIKGAKVIKRPNTEVGDEFTSAIITVSYDDGTEVDTKVLIYVREPCKPCPAPEPGDNPGGGDYIPTPDPNPTLPDDGDDEKEPEDKEKTPDEENGKEKEDNPDKDKDKTPEKPGEKDPKKPGQNQPPVKNDSQKKQGQTGTKIVKTINQTGTKVINQVKNFLNPTTGIISNYGLYIGLMAASSVGLFFTRDKKNEDEE
ncbi:InlB B-repeat-containing protein [uncultured Anaerococcus sp.]|uniref:InlB B-repeat-containing protein n=1 Tax=uncultured Anaerococcus sp. TaxID=293428 RepID=UPI00280BD503|nr:InlB B-repeat-containing protein [uncultured Anaerococcus sp.]